MGHCCPHFIEKSEVFSTDLQQSSKRLWLAVRVNIGLETCSRKKKGQPCLYCWRGPLDFDVNLQLLSPAATKRNVNLIWGWWRATRLEEWGGHVQIDVSMPRVWCMSMKLTCKCAVTRQMSSIWDTGPSKSNGSSLGHVFHQVSEMSSQKWRRTHFCVCSMFPILRQKCAQCTWINCFEHFSQTTQYIQSPLSTNHYASISHFHEKKCETLTEYVKYAVIKELWAFSQCIHVWFHLFKMSVFANFARTWHLTRRACRWQAK